MRRFLDESLAAEIKNEPKSAAAKQARKMGLSYGGFGRYLNKEGQVAYVVEKGKLVPFKGAEDVRKMYDKAYSGASKNPEKGRELEKEANFYSKTYDARQNADFKFFDKLARDSYKMNDQLNKLTAPFYDSLDDHEMQTIQDYTDMDFEGINRYLYKGHDEGADMRRDREIVQKISTLDGILDQSEAPMSYTVYSGLSSRYKAEKILAGEKYLFRGYMSTTLNPTVATNAFTEESKEGRVILQIEITQGQKALHIDAVSTKDNEMETLLPRGSMVHIVSGPHPIDPNSIDPNATEDSGGVQLFHCLLVQDEDE